MGAMVPNDAVKLIECPRDAWQGLKKTIPTETKIAYLRKLVELGFRHLDADAGDVLPVGASRAG